MYWVWASELTADDEAAVDGPPTAGGTGVEFDAGVLVAEVAFPVEVRLGTGAARRLADCILLRGGGGLLFSSRLRAVLAAAGVDNVQYVPALVRHPADGTATDDHHIANIVGRVACVDRARSVLDAMPGEPEAMPAVEVLAIDARRAGGFDLFRLHEEPSLTIASDRVRQACERHGITGVHFYAPEEYLC